MQEYQIPYVQLHAVFPESYPFEPPFIRVVSPYIERGKFFLIASKSPFLLQNQSLQNKSFYFSIFYSLNL